METRAQVLRKPVIPAFSAPSFPRKRESRCSGTARPGGRGHPPASGFTGVHNENEFYSRHHYLSEVFADDIRETVERWREATEGDSRRAGSGRTAGDGPTASDGPRPPITTLAARRILAQGT